MLKLWSSDTQKETKSPTPQRLQLEHHQSQSPAMSIMHTSPEPLVPDRIPSQESSLSPESIHAITALMGHPLSSEPGNYIHSHQLLALLAPHSF